MILDETFPLCTAHAPAPRAHETLTLQLGHAWNNRSVHFLSLFRQALNSPPISPLNSTPEKPALRTRDNAECI